MVSGLRWREPPVVSHFGLRCRTQVVRPEPLDYLDSQQRSIYVLAKRVVVFRRIGSWVHKHLKLEID